MGAFLSDAFQHSDKSGRFEWTAQMININEGRKEGRLSTLVELVADGSMSISKAAEKAMLSIEEFQLQMQNNGYKL